MSFYCTHYHNTVSNEKAFAYCMKRLPNGGKCNELSETKKGKHKRGNASIHRDDNGKHVLRRKMGPIHAFNYSEYEDMDS